MYCFSSQLQTVECTMANHLTDISRFSCILWGTGVSGSTALRSYREQRVSYARTLVAALFFFKFVLLLWLQALEMA